jgi:uncharacterized protein (TIGR03435 family)
MGDSGFHVRAGAGQLRAKSLLLLLALRPAVFAAAVPDFEVATVKQSPPPAGDAINIDVGTVRNGKVTFSNASLSDCLKFACGIVSDDQIIGPDWIKSKAVRFDIVAQAPLETSREHFSLMLRALLADRLKLELHHEQRVLPFLALTPGKGGLKIKPVEAGGPQTRSNSASAGRIHADAMSMQLLATLLSRFERQTVVDMTGLGNAFQLNLEWAPGLTGGQGANSPDTPSCPSIFTAVGEQLGLRLEFRKSPLDVLVVDHAEQTPSAN